MWDVYGDEFSGIDQLPCRERDLNNTVYQWTPTISATKPKRQVIMAFAVLNPSNGAVIRGGNAGFKEGAETACCLGELGILSYCLMGEDRNWYDFASSSWLDIPAKPNAFRKWDDDDDLWFDQWVLADPGCAVVVIDRAYVAEVALLTAGLASEIATWPNQPKDAQAWSSQRCGHALPRSDPRGSWH